MGQLPDIQSKANVCNYTAAPAAAPVYSEGIWSCSSLESVQHKGGIKPFLHSHPFASCTFCAISLVKHSTESFNVNCWIGSSGVWLFSLPSRGTSVLLRMGLVPINELIRCSLLWWLVLKLPARCVGVFFLFLFCSDEGDMKVSLQVINKKKKNPSFWHWNLFVHCPFVFFSSPIVCKIRSKWQTLDICQYCRCICSLLGCSCCFCLHVFWPDRAHLDTCRSSPWEKSSPKSGEIDRCRAQQWEILHDYSDLLFKTEIWRDNYNKHEPYFFKDSSVAKSV